MGMFGMGQPVPRTEDPRLLTGRGHYVSDVRLQDMAWGYTVRSPFAHADILAIDTNTAKAAPGILAVYTHLDLEAAGYGLTHPHFPPRKRPKDGNQEYWASHPGLVGDRVRMIGDAVAFVVAETLSQAKDAAELVQVDYEERRVVTDTALAADPLSPQLYDAFPNNISNVAEFGNKDAVDDAFEKASHVTRQRFVINRISTNAMETRGCVGAYDRYEDRYTMYCDTQSPHGSRKQLAQEILGVPETKVRVVARDIGGAFGLKDTHFPENRLCLLAARDLERPVKWVCERSEGFVADDHARDVVTEAELALDGDGRFLALRIRNTNNLGAYLTAGSGMVPTFMNLGGLAGVYKTPAIHVEVTCVYTNTQSTTPYRGAGRPEASYVLERMIDLAAGEMDIDRIDLRRRNMIPPDAMPYQTGLSFKYDSGEFEKNLDLALVAADISGFENRRAESAEHGKLRGFSVIQMVEQASGPRPEYAELRFDASGTLTVLAGTKGQGQGHDTMYKIMISDMLGMDTDDVRLEEGDTDKVSFGMGTVGSRSAVTGGGAVRYAADKIIEKGKKIAAHMLEAAEVDIEFDRGRFRIAGTDKQVGIQDVAKAAFTSIAVPSGMEIGLYENATYTPEAASYPNGCHICEVDIDEDTGKVTIVKYIAVDDVGTVVNMLTLTGQVHGGIVQGAGQALMENIVYDPGNGQMLSGSFMDYSMPKADDFCSFEVTSNPVPAKTNPLGIKGAGEAGTTGALPAVMNAVNHALKDHGVRHLEMPLTAEKVWRAIHST